MLNKNILWDISYGVYIVTTLDKDKPAGCVANCVVQVTNNFVAVSINHTNYTNELIKENKEFAISILSEKTNRNIIAVFGFSSGRNRNKFEKVQYKMINNLPVIEDSKGYITLKTVKTVELDTHTVFIGEITGGEVFNDEVPMTYKYYHDVIKGKAPEAAPTYIAPEELSKEKTPENKEKGDNLKKRYRCKICGYIYEGDITKEAPNYLCPVCKQPKSAFEEVAYA